MALLNLLSDQSLFPRGGDPPLRSFELWDASRDNQKEWDSMSGRVHAALTDPSTYPLPILPLFRVGWESGFGDDSRWYQPGFYLNYGLDCCLPGFSVGEQRRILCGAQGGVTVGACIHVLRDESKVKPIVVASWTELEGIIDLIHQTAIPFARQHRLIDRLTRHSWGMARRSITTSQRLEFKMLRQRRQLLPRATLNISIGSGFSFHDVPTRLDSRRPVKQLTELLG